MIRRLLLGKDYPEGERWRQLVEQARTVARRDRYERAVERRYRRRRRTA